ncbi:MAG: Transcriptional regulator, AraC family, partial [uncultured Blastococcus sp.]
GVLEERDNPRPGGDPAGDPAAGRDRRAHRAAPRRPGERGVAALRRAVLVGALGPHRPGAVPLRGAQPSQRQRVGGVRHRAALRLRDAGGAAARGRHPPLRRRPDRRRPGDRGEVPAGRLHRPHRGTRRAQLGRAARRPAGRAGRPAARRRPGPRGRRRPGRRARRRLAPVATEPPGAYLDLLSLIGAM